MHQDLLNASALEELKDIMEEDFVDLVDVFIEDSPNRINLILNSGDDTETVRKAAHALKGAAGNISAMALHDLCETLEHECKNGSLSKPLNTWGEEIEQCFNASASALRKHC